MSHKDPAAARAYRKKRRAHDRDKERERYATDPSFRARKIESAKKTYQQNRDHYLAAHRKWAKEHPHLMRMYVRKYMRKFRSRACFDANFYAWLRAKGRIERARATVNAGKRYRPRFAMRITDGTVKGARIVDASSKFLDINITAEMRAYVRALAIERKENRTR